MAQTVCPKCGSTNVGTTTAHKLKKGATYAADFALGFLFGEAAVDVMSETGGVSDNVSIKKEFQCRNCGYVWKDDGIDRVPDHILQEQKNHLAIAYHTEAKSYLNKGIVWGIITAACGLYCLIQPSRTLDTFWFGDSATTYSLSFTWLFICILGVVGIFKTINKISKYNEKNGISTHLSNMSVTEFRTSSYRQLV